MDFYHELCNRIDDWSGWTVVGSNARELLHCSVMMYYCKPVSVTVTISQYSIVTNGQLLGLYGLLVTSPRGVTPSKTIVIQ